MAFFSSRCAALSLMSVPLMLTACGEGYDMSRIKGVVPYTLERTAGTGVAYVRAKMMPEKQLVIAPAETKVEAPVAAEQPEKKLKDMEPIFHDKQKK